MSLKFDKLGKYIRLVDFRNTTQEVTEVRGISTSKEIIKTVANLKDVDLSTYKIVDNGQFVYVPDTSRRGEKIAIALNTDSKFLVSNIYTVFEIKDIDKLVPEYLMIYFNRPEFDRYARFNSFGSAREVFSWEDICDIIIPVPDLSTQKLLTSIYSSLMNDKKTYKKGLVNLNIICESYIENLKSDTPLKRLGDYIQYTDERNNNWDLEINNVRGISITKTFIQSQANMEDVSLRNYKIVHNKEFAYVPVTSRNGEKLSIALCDGDDYLVSGTYITFKVKDANVLMPEFLMLWFKRADFDRYARFHSIGSAREIFSFEDMCNVMLPVPEDIEVQKSIVALHRVLEARVKINERLKPLLAALCPLLMKGVMESAY